MKRILLSTLAGMLAVGTLIPTQLFAVESALSGRFLIQVQSRGEAWYVKPDDGMRIFIDPQEPEFFLSAVAIGISNADLKKIPVANVNLSGEANTQNGFGWYRDGDTDGLSDDAEYSFGTNAELADTDTDGHSDGTEIVNGYDPLKKTPARLPIDTKFAGKHAGKLFKQVENDGEYWYVNPVDGKRYFISLSDNLFYIIQKTAVGITDAKLARIKETRPYGNDTPAPIGGQSETITLIDEVIEAPTPVPVTNPIQPDVPDCGSITTDTSDEEDEAVYECINQYLKDCKTARMDIDVDLGILGQLSTRELIVAKEGTTCLIKTEVTSSSLAEWTGKTMTCPYPDGAKYEEYMVDPKQCTGDLTDLFNGMGEGDMGDWIDPEESPKTDIFFDQLGQGVYDGPLMPGQQMIADEKQLASLWQRLYPFNGSRPAQPNIDFTKESIYVFFGNRGSRELMLKSLQEDEFYLYGEATEKGLATACAEQYQVTQAFQVIKLVKRDKYLTLSTLQEGLNDACSPARVTRKDFIYTDKNLDVAFELSDAVAFFDIKSVAKDDRSVEIIFSQTSKSEGRAYEIFKIVAVPHEQLKKSRVGASKLGSNSVYTFFFEAPSEQTPDDVLSYWMLYGITMVK